MANLQERMIRAAKLDVELYKEVEADASATGQAVAVVTISAVAAGLGNMQSTGPLGIIVSVVIALVGWYVSGYLAYVIGAKFVPEPQTDTSPEKLLRALGFASAPGVIQVLAFVPGLSPLVFSVAAVWMLVTMIIAIRQALGYQSTWRAIGVCVLVRLIQGLILFFIIGPARFLPPS